MKEDLDNNIKSYKLSRQKLIVKQDKLIKHKNKLQDENSKILVANENLELQHKLFLTMNSGFNLKINIDDFQQKWRKDKKSFTSNATTIATYGAFHKTPQTETGKKPLVSCEILLPLNEMQGNIKRTKGLDSEDSNGTSGLIIKKGLKMLNREFSDSYLDNNLKKNPDIDISIGYIHKEKGHSNVKDRMVIPRKSKLDSKDITKDSVVNTSNIVKTIF